MARFKQKGLFGVYAYRCLRCFYVWLPKDIEILKADSLLELKPPKSCARCKSRLWKTPEKSVSIARVRALLRKGHKRRVIYLLSQIEQKQADKIINTIGREFPTHEAIGLGVEVGLSRTVVRSKEQKLETFKPPT